MIFADIRSMQNTPLCTVAVADIGNCVNIATAWIRTDVRSLTLWPTSEAAVGNGKAKTVVGKDWKAGSFQRGPGRVLAGGRSRQASTRNSRPSPSPKYR